jgi:hypothetical protein
MTKKKKESDAVKIARANRHTEWLRLVGKIFDTLPKYILAGFVLYIFKDMVHELAGKEALTNIKIDIPFLSSAIGLLLGGGGLAYGIKQNKLRKDTIQQQSKRIKDLEHQSDKNRSSSELTERGDTNPEDT